MSIFNYIDTFFFISLGITFILILLLVFHFKQRITHLENKNDAMFEIINNIVKELSNIKSVIMQPVHTHIPFEYHQPLSVPIINEFTNERIFVSDDDASEDAYDEHDDASEDDASEDDDDYASEDDDDKTSDDNSDSDRVYPDNKFQQHESLNDDIKIVNIDVSELLTDIVEPEPIVVEKLAEIDEAAKSHKTNDLEQNQKETTKEIYRKMNLQSLKSLVITKGLSSDTSKMRKQELINLLESIMDE
jgi:hypothetical protein